jgi:hypothetical protein
MDPLSILRTFVVKKELDRVLEQESEIDFGGRFRFAKSTPTAYKSEEGKGPFYDLQSVLFFARTFEKPDVSFQGYFKEAKERGLMSVRALDRKVSSIALHDPFLGCSLLPMHASTRFSLVSCNTHRTGVAPVLF